MTLTQHLHSTQSHSSPTSIGHSGHTVRLWQRPVETGPIHYSPHVFTLITAQMCSHSPWLTPAHTQHSTHVHTLKADRTCSYTTAHVCSQSPHLTSVHTYHDLCVLTLTHSTHAHTHRGLLVLTVTAAHMCSHPPPLTCAHTCPGSYVLTITTAHVCSHSPRLTSAYTHQDSQDELTRQVHDRCAQHTVGHERHTPHSPPFTRGSPPSPIHLTASCIQCGQT